MAFGPHLRLPLLQVRLLRPQNRPWTGDTDVAQRLRKRDECIGGEFSVQVWAMQLKVALVLAHFVDRRCRLLAPLSS